MNSLVNYHKYLCLTHPQPSTLNPQQFSPLCFSSFLCENKLVDSAQIVSSQLAISRPNSLFCQIVKLF